MLEATTALKNWLKVNLGITLLIAFSQIGVKNCVGIVDLPANRGKKFAGIEC